MRYGNLRTMHFILACLLMLVFVGAASATASFTTNATNGSAPLTVLFTDTSTGSPSSWQWNFGDGTANSTSQNPTHTFSSVGLYTVTLTAGGSTTTSRIAVLSYAYAYVANYASNSVSVINTFNNTVVTTIAVGTGPTSVSVAPYGWEVLVSNVGSNTVSVINTITNTVTTTISGFSSPCGIVFSPDGTKAYVANVGKSNISIVNMSTYTITNNVIGANATGNTRLAISPNGGTLYISNTGTSNTIQVANLTNNTVYAGIANGAPCFDMAMYWDGSTIFAHKSGTAYINVINTSTYAVTGTITDDSGSFAFSPDYGTLYGTHIGAGTLTYINMSNFTSYKTVTTGTKSMGVSLTPEGHKIFVANNGSNNVAVINSFTGVLTSTISVGVQPQSIGNFIQPYFYPVPIFTVNTTTPAVGAAVQFNESSYGVPMPNRWAWLFGDGGSSTAQNPVHVYTSPGTYTVSLTTYSSLGGQTTTKVGYINVFNNSINCSFVANNTIISAGGYVHFIDTTTKDYTNQWSWDIPGVAYSPAQNMICQFWIPGTYSITHTANNTLDGVKSSVTYNNFITVTAASGDINTPASFISDVNGGFVPTTVTFTDTTPDSINASWDFGDGTNGTGKVVSHTYTTLGSYTITLTSNTPNGVHYVISPQYIAIYVAGQGGIGGYITDSYSGSPLTNASVTISNATYSIQGLTDQYGHYYFPNLYAGNYNITVSATGYTQYTMGTNVTSGSTSTMSMIVVPQQTTYYPHYVKWTLTGPFWLGSYPGINVRVYNGSSVSGNALMTNTTGNDGSVTYQMTEGSTYTVWFNGTGINVTDTETISANEYDVWAWSTTTLPNIKTPTYPANLTGSISYNVTPGPINSTNGSLNISIQAIAGSGTITAWNTAITQVNSSTNTTPTGNWSYSTSGSGNTNLSLIPPAGYYYQVKSNVTHSAFGTQPYNNTYQVPYSGVAPGWNMFNQTNSWMYGLFSVLAMFGLLGILGSDDKRYGGVLLIGAGWMCVFIGWLPGGNFYILYGIATLIALEMLFTPSGDR